MRNHHTPTSATAACMVAAPVLALASAVVAPALKSNEGAQLEVIARHPDRWYAYTVLLFAAMLLLVPAFLGVAATARRRSPRLADAGGALAALGIAISASDAFSQLVSWQMVAAGADRAQMTQLLERLNGTAGIDAIFSIGGLSALVGTILLTVALLRGRTAPAWAAVGLTAALVLNLVGFTASSAPVILASWALLLAVMASIGRALLGGAARHVQDPRLGHAPAPVR